MRIIRQRRSADERGTAAVELPAAIALLLVPVALAVMMLPNWPERQTVARAAASEAARTAVLADTWEQGVTEGGEAVAQAAENQGIDAGDVAVAWEGGLERGASVTALVTVQVPSLTVPLVGTVGSWSWTASHTERVDDYRSMAEDLR